MTMLDELIVRLNAEKAGLKQAEPRNKWRAYYDEVSQIRSADMKLVNEWMASKGPYPPYVSIPDFPEELRGFTCGAKTRAGHPCRMTNLYPNGRCKFHGGLSTGPLTPEGKKRSAKNGFRCAEK